MKKIIFVLPTLQGGGAEKVISSLALSFDKKKYIIYILVFNLSKQIYLKKKKIRIINLKANKIRSGVFKFIKFINKIKPDVIMSTVSHLNLMISLIKFFLPKKTKLVARESNFLSKNLELQSNSVIMRFFYKLFYNNFDLSLVFSNSHKKDIIENTNLKKKKIKILHNPVDFNLISKLSQKKINNKYKKFFLNNSKKFIFVGSLSFQKGIDIFIEILNKCKNKNFIYNIIGNGSELQSLKKLVREKKLQNNINFIPYQSNPFPYIALSDAYVMSSRFEGMSNIVLETLVLKKPIVFFDGIGASTQLLKKMKNAYLLKKDIKNFSEKFIDSKRLRNSKSSNISYLKKFSIQNVVKSYEKTIDDLLKKDKV